jgi:hypothetical protein
MIHGLARLHVVLCVGIVNPFYRSLRAVRGSTDGYVKVFLTNKCTVY